MHAPVDVLVTTRDATTPPGQEDLARVQALDADTVDVEVCPVDSGAAEWRFTMYVNGGRVALSTVLPILHSLGAQVLDERPYRVGERRWIYDFTLRQEAASAQDTTLPPRFCAAVLACWRGACEVDDFNTLVVHAGLSWQQAALLRAYARYLRQAGFSYGTTRIAEVLRDHPAACSALSRLFAAMFDPHVHNAETATALDRSLRAAIDEVSGLDADRILRAYADLMAATLRTNFYRPRSDDCPRSAALALKLDARRVAQLPCPRPRLEVFVYSPRVEGVHMRFGAVARGGLRWSDRREDFRTEVLGLAKTQAVKNAVIVPLGAKGGFVAKKPPTVTGAVDDDRAALYAEGVACYRSFIAALLDITDNKDAVTGSVLPPAGVVRRDGDDPYLVVAADKGTASFSDHANAVAAQYGFWLGDAFASGGSIGYDHKAMGITARGAWESVRRHFFELDLDVDTTDFTVVGIGDMSGDVFGNAMLLSPHIRLVAAFDHRHIFIDPEPDAHRSYAERRRLFELPRSTWADYDRTLLGAGGGVYDRSAKSVRLSEAARVALALSEDDIELSPGQLISAILRAPVDLLFNGGVGTYVKATGESHLDVGDKANDHVRVDAPEVGARVIGEGGNLGVTARGRIEAADTGHKINTDAVDNSAGVDCSDHEVNIKILLDGLLYAGRIDAPERIRLLRDMTDDVARMVLANNISANDMLGSARSEAAELIAVHGRQLSHLASAHGVDRALEVLPDEAEIRRRSSLGLGLTSPELATLSAHVKLALKAELLASPLPNHDAFFGRLLGYFPPRLARDHPDAIAAHPLRREIVATVLANEVVDLGGVSYLFRLGEDTGASSADAVRAFAAAAAIIDLPALMARVRGQAATAAVRDIAVGEVRRLLDRVSRWLLARRPQPVAVGAEIARYRAAMTHLMPAVTDRLAGPDADVVAARTAELTALGAESWFGRELFSSLHGYCGLDIVDIADAEGRDLDDVADLYYALNAHLRIDHLLTAISALDDNGDRWRSLAKSALREDVYGAVRLLCRDVLANSTDTQSAPQKIADWASTNKSRLARSRTVLDQIIASSPLDVTALAVAAHQLRALVRMRPA